MISIVVFEDCAALLCAGVAIAIALLLDSV